MSRQKEPRRMQATKVLAGEFIEVAVVERRALPAHAPDQAQHAHALCPSVRTTCTAGPSALIHSRMYREGAWAAENGGAVASVCGRIKESRVKIDYCPNKTQDRIHRMKSYMDENVIGTGRRFVCSSYQECLNS